MMTFMRHRIASAFLLLLSAAILAPAAAQDYVISTYAGWVPPPQTAEAGVDLELGDLKGIGTDAAGNVYFVSNYFTDPSGYASGLNCVFKLDRNGFVTLIAGKSRPGFSGDGGPAVDAQLEPSYAAYAIGVAVDGAGNLFITDLGNYRVRKVSNEGIITTVAGNGTAGFSGDGGPATEAQINPM